MITPVWEIILFFVAQSVIIIGAIVAAHIRMRVELAKLAIQVKIVQEMATSLKGDHGLLSSRVGGISRSLARLEGFVNATREIKSALSEEGKSQ